jgi:hypothetical protein
MNCGVTIVRIVPFCRYAASTPPLWGSANPTYMRGSSRFFTRRPDKSERVLERKAANPKLRMAGSGALPPEAPDPATNRYTGSASRQAEGDRHGSGDAEALAA